MKTVLISLAVVLMIGCGGIESEEGTTQSELDVFCIEETYESEEACWAYNLSAAEACVTDWGGTPDCSQTRCGGWEFACL